MSVSSSPASPRSSPPASPRSVIPREYFCPITLELLTDGVQAPDGFTYERTAIERWRTKWPDGRSPRGGGHIPRGELVPNRTLMAAIDDHLVAGPQLRAARQALKEAAKEAAAKVPPAASPGAADATPAGLSSEGGASSAPPRQLTAPLAAAAVGTLAYTLSGRLGTGWQGCLEFLFDVPGSVSLGWQVIAPWVGGGAALWAWMGAHEADATEGINLTLSGLGLPVLSGGAAIAGGVIGFIFEPNSCLEKPLTCAYGGPSTVGARLGAIIGTGLATSLMGYAALRALQAACRALDGPRMEGALRFEATVDHVMQLGGYGAPLPLLRVESMEDPFSR